MNAKSIHESIDQWKYNIIMHEIVDIAIVWNAIFQQCLLFIHYPQCVYFSSFVPNFHPSFCIKKSFLIIQNAQAFYIKQHKYHSMTFISLYMWYSVSWYFFSLLNTINVCGYIVRHQPLLFFKRESFFEIISSIIS